METDCDTTKLCRFVLVRCLIQRGTLMKKKHAFGDEILVPLAEDEQVREGLVLAMFEMQNFQMDVPKERV